jgi:uncharacterized protein YndB with AHSA1/START domain
MLMDNTIELICVGDLEIRARRAFAAPRQLVWDCHVKPELVRRWLLGPEGWTMTLCEIDLRVGGRYRHEMRHRDGRAMGWGGVYREIGAPETLVMTQLFDEDWTGGETLVSHCFEEAAGRTTLTISTRYSSKPAREAALTSGMTRGMEAGYRRIDEILATFARN